MIISVIQPDTVWEDKNTNFGILEKLISPLYLKSDIVILPEMFNTGFSMNTGLFSENPDGETYRWMLDCARKGDFAICGSYMVKDNSDIFNRWSFVTPEGKRWDYDKRHLFSIGRENLSFKPGVSRLIFTFRDVRISANICYDLRFPVWSRNCDEYDLLIYSANWPESRRDVWNTLLRARAIENQCYVAGANRIGTDGMGIHYCGDSVIVDPRGSIINSALPDEETSISSEISMEDLSDFRHKFPVGSDADDFTINI